MKVADMLRILSLCASGALLGGCAEVAPFTTGMSGSAANPNLEIRSQTSVLLEEGNFVIVRTNVVGSSQGFKLLGFITLCPATVDKAMNELYAKAQLEEGQPETLAHLMVERSGIYVILFSIPKVTARADLIEFFPTRDEEEENSSKAFGLRPVVHRPRLR